MVLLSIYFLYSLLRDLNVWPKDRAVALILVKTIPILDQEYVRVMLMGIVGNRFRNCGT